MEGAYGRFMKTSEMKRRFKIMSDAKIAYYEGRKEASSYSGFQILRFYVYYQFKIISIMLLSFKTI